MFECSFSPSYTRLSVRGHNPKDLRISNLNLHLLLLLLLLHHKRLRDIQALLNSRPVVDTIRPLAKKLELLDP